MDGQQIPAVLHLGPVPEASMQARRFVRESLQLLGISSLSESAELGVSELVTNACLHARTAITVSLRQTAPGVIRIEVSDDSPHQPSERQFESTTTTGRGLKLLSAYGTWGVDGPIDGRIGKTVWFQPGKIHDIEAEALHDDWASS